MNRYILLVALAASLGMSTLEGHYTHLARKNVSTSTHLDFAHPPYKLPKHSVQL